MSDRIDLTDSVYPSLRNEEIGENDVRFNERKKQEGQKEKGRKSSRLPPVDPPVHVVKPQTVPEPSFMQSFAELMHDVMPQSSTTSKLPDHERVDWVAFQQCDLNDVRFTALLQPLIGNRPPLIMVVGLAKGFQIWCLTSLGDCQLIFSDRQGPVEIVRLLPTPEPCFANSNHVSPISPAHRPLMAVVEGTAASGTKAGCALSIVSMQSGKHLLTHRYESPVLRVDASSRALVIAFSGRVMVYDTSTFTEQLDLVGVWRYDDSAIPTATALQCNQLAYVDNKLSPIYQSCGGLSTSELPSTYTSQVITVAKNLGKSVTALGESVVTSLSSSNVSAMVSQHSPGRSSPLTVRTQPSVVTVIDLAKFATAPVDRNSPNDLTQSEGTTGIIAHFCAHADEAVHKMCMSESGNLLCTSGQSGQYVHVFNIQVHPVHSSMTAVQHIYTLQRGQTPAKIQDLSLSRDSRWLAASTNHGTTHIFPITPYGGAISMRTHGQSRVPNKDSRFHKSAGLDAISDQSFGTVTSSAPSASPGSGGSHRGSPITRESHPCIYGNHQSLARASVNSRLPPYSSAQLVHAATKIHQQMLSPSTLTARATDIVPGSSSSSSSSSHAKRHSSSTATNTDGPYLIRTAFAPSVINTTTDSVFLLNSQGQLIEYNMVVSAATESNKKYSAQTPISLQLCPTALWSVQRQRGMPEVSLPLRPSHILMLAARVMNETLAHHSVRQLIKPSPSTNALSQMNTNNNNNNNNNNSNSNSEKSSRKSSTTEKSSVFANSATNNSSATLTTTTSASATESSQQSTPDESPMVPVKSKKNKKMGATRLNKKDKDKDNNGNGKEEKENGRTNKSDNVPAVRDTLPAQTHTKLIEADANTRSRSNSNRPVDESSRYWVSQVEIFTYNGPHRRLWMGPQFTFKTYRDSPHVLADLMSPSDARHSEKTKRKRNSSGGDELLKNVLRRSEPMSMPGRSVPVLIEAASDSFDKSFPGVTVEVCGSWSDNDYISCDEQEGRVRECIADAMIDVQPIQQQQQQQPRRSAPVVTTGKQRTSSKSDASPRISEEATTDHDTRSDLSDSTEADLLQFVP